MAMKQTILLLALLGCVNAVGQSADWTRNTYSLWPRFASNIFKISLTNGVTVNGTNTTASEVFRVQNQGTNQFRVSPNSGYTGTGTNFMSDDGTFKAVSASPSGSAGGDLAGSYPNPTLATTAVTNGVYGSATQIPSIQVDSKGRVIAATNISFTAGTTINSTDGYIPVRGSSTTFTNSPWYVNATNKVAFNGTGTFIRTVPTTTSVNGAIGIGASTLGGLSSGGTYNSVAFGHEAMSGLTSGSGEAFGYGALSSLTTGTFNIGIGAKSAYSLSSGSRTVSIGYQSGYYVPSASDWIAIGYDAGTDSTNLSQSVIIGSRPLNNAGRFNRNFQNNVIIGYKNFAITNDVASVTNSIYIGSNIDPSSSNTAQIGTNGVSVLYLNGTVGWFRGSGDPEGSVAAPVGSYYTREDGAAGSTLYTKVAGTAAIGWTNIATGGGGTTINSTDGYIPYRSSSTAFADSPLYRVNSTSVGIATTTNVLTSSGTILSYTNSSTSIHFRVQDGAGTIAQLGTTTGGHLLLLGGTGSAVYIGQNNNGSGDWVITPHLVPTTDGSTDFGSQSSQIRDIYIKGAVKFNGGTIIDAYGSGSPEGVVTGSVGSTYRRTDGGAGTSFYVKESGSGNTGWVAK